MSNPISADPTRVDAKPMFAPGQLYAAPNGNVYRYFRAEGTQKNQHNQLVQLQEDLQSVAAINSGTNLPWMPLYIGENVVNQGEYTWYVASGRSRCHSWGNAQIYAQLHLSSSTKGRLSGTGNIEIYRLAMVVDHGSRSSEVVLNFPYSGVA